ncbi:MAG: class D sortase [Clostridia bacterium]|nr:class D sortase [Clostridia bacterium]
MAVNKSKARKIKRRLAYLYFPLIFAVVGIIVARFIFVAIVPNYKDYRLLAFGNPPSFSERLDQKSFVAYDGEQKDTIDNITEVTLPKFNQQYAEIKCADIGLEAPVFWGDSDMILRSGVGTYMASSLPGYGTGILMSAHNTTYFKGLKDVKTGDVISLTTTYAKFAYRVSDIKVLDADDANAVDFLSKTEQLVLYTCYPFQPFSAVSEQRLFVYCDKVAGPSVSNVEVDL